MDIEIINQLKQRLTGQSSLLDIGFGAGRVSFEILSEMTIGKISGIESRKKDEIEKDYNLFLGPETDTRIYGLIKDGRIDLYDYYRYIASEENNEPLDFESFNRNLNILFNKKFKNFIEENKSRYDLVILLNVLHYSDIGEPIWVLNQLTDLLTENGLVLISFKKYKLSDGELNGDRQEIDINKAIKYLENNFKTIVTKDCETEDSIIYLGKQYAPQQRL